MQTAQVIRNHAVRLGLVNLIALVSASFPNAWANPAYDTIVALHVSDVLNDTCEDVDVTECESVRQSTEMLGVIEFDLVFYELDLGVHWNNVFTVAWPEEWTLLEYELCAEGSTIYLSENMLEIFVPDLVPLHVARIVMEAPTYDQIRCYGYGSLYGGEWYAACMHAWAGQECGACPLPCTIEEMGYHCFVIYDTYNLYLTTEQGGSAFEQLEVMSHNSYDWCDVEFGTTQPWLALDVQSSGTGRYDLAITADASSLPPGEHIGWVEGTSSTCSRCLKVILTVTETTPVQSASWGMLKNLYR